MHVATGEVGDGFDSSTHAYDVTAGVGLRKQHRGLEDLASRSPTGVRSANAHQVAGVIMVTTGCAVRADVLSSHITFSGSITLDSS